VRERDELAAVDRRELSRRMPPKPAKWPRTRRREDRIRAVLSRRQPDLTVVLENVHDPHNVSAVIRSCDAVGVKTVHGVYTEEERPTGFARRSSSGAGKWVELRFHDSVGDCYQELRSLGFSIWATALRDSGIDLYDLDLASPSALVFGNEMRGLSADALAFADGTLSIPMQGMAESLNISVACAVTLFEAMRQRRISGHYTAPKLSPDALEATVADWLKR
jgi:tRNA (guanosine-2'-O-)-methyltransferase